MTLSDKAALDAQATADALFKVIEHGDEKHRAWLKQELRDWFAALRAEPPADVAELVEQLKHWALGCSDSYEGDALKACLTGAAATLASLSRRVAELGAMLAGPPASQSDRAVVAVGPITRIKGTDSISCPGLPSGMMCFGWAEQGWEINDKDGKRVATGDWGDCATIHLESSQSDEALVEELRAALLNADVDPPYDPSISAILPIIDRERAAARREGIEEAAKFLRDQDGYGEWQEAADQLRALGEKP